MDVISNQEDLRAITARLRGSSCVGLDIESNGMFAYRAQICIVQIAAPEHLVVVDALATPLSPLDGLLGEDGPVKIVHDVAFDARMLAESNLTLGNVRDTAIAARMLGRSATGLSALLSEIGIVIDKKMQKHDWSRR